MPSAVLCSPSRHENLVSSYPPETVFPLLHMRSQSQSYDTENEDCETNPHENLAPFTKEANERGVTIVPTTSIEVLEE